MAKKRLIFGETWYNEPSRFLKDIPASLVRKSDCETRELDDDHIETLSPVSIYVIGDEVLHKRFGSGVIQAMKGDDLVIKFSSGEKLLSAKYAPLEKA